MAETKTAKATKRVKPDKALRSRTPTARKDKHAKPAFELSPQGLLAWAQAHKGICATIAVIIFLLFVLYPPACSYYAAVRTNSALSSKLEDVNSQVDELSGDVNKLTSEEGLKDEARRLGYVEPGDTAVDMEGVEDSGGATSDTTVMNEATEEEEELPWYLVVSDFIFRYNPENEGLG